LVRSELAAVQKFSEGAPGSFSVEPYERADETGEPAFGLEFTECRFLNASLKENALKLLRTSAEAVDCVGPSE
jgi:hypothetical protein